MRFCHFLISGLMVGAAMCLPDHVFAEKNESNGQQNSQKDSMQVNTSVKTDRASVQPNVSEQAETTKSLEKTVVVPEPAIKNQGEVKQDPSNITPPQAKPAAVPQNLPYQAKSNVELAIKKTEKTDQAPESKKAAAVQANNKGGVKNNLDSKNEARNSALFSLHITDNEINKVQSETQGEGPLLIRKKGKVPVSKDESPTASQVLNPTQRTSSTGGKPNDRASQGLGTTSLMDKWFEWEKYDEIKLVQPYLSRHALMNNQWVNAPPSPPPQGAPLLETVNRS